MKRTILACLLALAPGIAAAADLPPLKAPALSNSYPTSTGFYFGVGAAGASTSVQASGLPGVNTAGLNAFGGIVYGTVGYVWGNADGTRFFRANLDGGIQNVNGQSSGISFSGPASFQVGLQAGVPFAQIAAFLPNLNLPNFPGLPTPPVGVTYGPPHMYAGLMADIEDVSFNFGAAQNSVWKVSPGLQIGMLVPTSNGLMLDPRFEYVFNDKGTCFGGSVVCANQGNTMRFKLGVEF
jgi:hypothetical protein